MRAHMCIKSTFLTLCFSLPSIYKLHPLNHTCAYIPSFLYFVFFSRFDAHAQELLKARREYFVELEKVLAQLLLSVCVPFAFFRCFFRCFFV